MTAESVRRSWWERINEYEWPRGQKLTEDQAGLIEETAIATDFARQAPKFILHHTVEKPWQDLKPADQRKWKLTRRLVYWLGLGHVRVTPVADRQSDDRSDDYLRRLLADQKERGNR